MHSIFLTFYMSITIMLFRTYCLNNYLDVRTTPFDALNNKKNKKNMFKIKGYLKIKKKRLKFFIIFLIL